MIGFISSDSPASRDDSPSVSADVINQLCGNRRSRVVPSGDSMCVDSPNSQNIPSVAFGSESDAPPESVVGMIFTYVLFTITLIVMCIDLVCGTSM